MKILLTAVALVAMVSAAHAQNSKIYIPREIKAAYDKGTRSYDGKPGPNYWQNTVDYDIEVSVAPETRELSGSETITLNNNSPNPLNTIVIRLYHDVFRKGNPRGMRVRDDDVNEGVDILMMTIDGMTVDLDENARRNGTNMYVDPPAPIAAGSSATIEIDWNMTIPETTRRTGAYDSTSFFVSYWYPQIAVYDDVFGWDALAYDFSTEFYNNLGNFDVAITAPVEFTVIATGVLQNPDEVFTAAKKELYDQAISSTETISIVSRDDISNGHQHRSGTWNFKADEVTDFSFCLSDHFVWDAAVQRVEDRDVLIHSYYNINVADSAAKLTQIQRKTMQHFSEDVPGVPYPYPEFATCVMGIGGGGMETPMMANNGQPGRGVTIHEMFHTYFPMYVRVNEKRFAWMDEGWADFNTMYVSRRYFQNDQDLFINNFAGQVGGTLGTISDLPLITSSQFMDNTNYGYASYPLPAFMYTLLHNHLGDDLFRQCYRQYILDWAQKSPTPYDFFFTFERVSGQDLSWFWNPWFFNYGDVDLKIGSFEKGKLEIAKVGSRPLPVTVDIVYEDSTTMNQTYSSAVWKTGATSFSVDVNKWKNVKSLTVNKSLPDANILDNYHPSLRERYGEFKMTADYLGEFPVNEFPVSVMLTEKDDLIHMAITKTGIATYLIPSSDSTFESLGGDMIVELTQGEGSVNVEVYLKAYGVRLTGSK